MGEVQKGDIVEVMTEKKYLYDSILYEFKSDKITFIKIREYEVMVAESHHDYCWSMKEYCNIHDDFILLVSFIFHFLMRISLKMNVSNTYIFVCL